MDISLTLAIFLLFLLNISTLTVLGQPPLGHINDNLPRHDLAPYIVHVQKPNGKKFHLFKHRKNWYKSFLPNTTLFNGEPRLIFAYRQVMTGFAAWLTQDELRMMESIDGFLLSHKDSELELRTTYTPELLGLNGPQGMWYDTNFGGGKIIGVIDTGAKKGHPSYRDHLIPPPDPKKWNGSCYWGKPTCNNKLIGAEAFSINGSGNPLDTDGHGSHTSTIAAGNFVDGAEVLGNARGTASGMAPRANLAIYKLIHAGSALLAAIDKAIRDGVDVINMSLGAGDPLYYRNSIAIGSFAAVTKGIVPCAAATNNGPRVSGIDNDAPWIVTVGAASTDRRITANVKLGDGREFDGESAYQPSSYASPQLPLVGIFYCLQTLNKTIVKDKIVLCESGRNNTKTGMIIKKAGGAAMVVLGTRGNTTIAEPHVLPASYVTVYARQQLTKYSTMPNPTAAIVFKGTQFGTKPSPAVATFSGRGPSNLNGGIIKPDVIAPGVNILAAWVHEVGLNQTGTPSVFSFQSGTSMATPHVAGVSALLMNSHPTWSTAAIKSAMMTTTFVTDPDGNPIEDQADGKRASIFAMGSGHIDPVAANDPGLIYDIKPHDYIRYLCGSGLFDDNQVNAIIRGNITCSTVRGIKIEELNYPSILVSLSANSTTKTVTRTVTNVGDVGIAYFVDFDEPKGVNIVVSDVVLLFNKVGEKKSFDVTFSYKSVPMPAGEISEGQLSWVSGKYLARIPLAVTSI